MHLEADTAGLFHSEVWNRDYPKLQILSIRELLEEGKKPQMSPFVMPTFHVSPFVMWSVTVPDLLTPPLRPDVNLF